MNNRTLALMPRPEMLAPSPNFLPYSYQKRPVLADDRRPKTAPEAFGARRDEDETHIFTQSMPRGDDRVALAPIQRMNNFMETSLFEKSVINISGEEDFLGQLDPFQLDGEVEMDPDVAWLVQAAPQSWSLDGEDKDKEAEHGHPTDPVANPDAQSPLSPPAPARRKAYSWLGERSPSPKQRARSPESQIPRSPNTQKPRSPNAAAHRHAPRSPKSPKEDDELFVHLQPSTSEGVRTEGSTAEVVREGGEEEVEEEESLRGLTRNTFEGRSTRSPYVDHLLRGGGRAELRTKLDIHNAVFKKQQQRSTPKVVTAARSQLSSVYTSSVVPDSSAPKLPHLPGSALPAHAHNSKPRTPSAVQPLPLPAVPTASHPAGGAVDVLHLLATSLSSADTSAATSSEVKVLAAFGSLPPALWVLGRLVYFLFVAFQECVLMAQEPLLSAYRALLPPSLHPLWGALRLQGLGMEEVHAQFSWPLLQALMRPSPSAFCRALALIEHGACLRGQPWQEFQSRLRDSCSTTQADNGLRGILVTPSGHSLGGAAAAHSWLLEVPDPGQVFPRLFPAQALAHLREVAAGARGALLLHPLGRAKGPHVPGSPLMVCAALTQWCRRVTTALFLQQQHPSPTPSPSLPQAQAQAQGRREQHHHHHQDHHDSAPVPVSRQRRRSLGLSLAVLMDAFQLPARYPALPAFLAALLALAKPADSLELLLLPDTPEGVPADALRAVLEDHLMATSCSPLHRVRLLAEDPLGGALPMHPGLLHLLGRAREREREREQPLDLLAVPLSSSSPCCCLLTPAAASSEEVLRDLRCSLLLLQSPTIPMHIPMPLSLSLSLAPSSSSSLRGQRFVVAVTDSARSWAAFHMAVRMAKESDSVMLLHLPSAAHLLQHSPAAPVRLTLGMHRALTAAALQRRDQVLARYRAQGYNVYCPQGKGAYIDTAVQAYRAHAQHLAYAARIASAADEDPFARYHTLSSTASYHHI